MAAESAWCWPWLSSGAAWFLFFNVVVGAVAVLSWRQGGDEPMSRRRRLTRSASSMVMERLRSMSVFAAFHSVPEHDYGSGLASPPSLSQLHHVQEYYTSSQVEGGEEVGHAVKQPEPALPEGERERLAAATVAPSTLSDPDAAAAAEVRSAASVSGSVKAEAETRMEVSRCLGDACTVAVVRQRAAPEPEPTPATAPAKSATTERPRKREPAKVAETVGRRVHAEIEEKAEVNARAERFIRQFREELKLERIKSIINQSAAASAR
ncbi:unnamed protein product [Triticum turgidum subsp. durum]|uniref:DUF4408 domain-containing protein n=1 Tax=Triticum turgidum subsp. durum TaxID=4567 RepID=A0A9R1BW10_TRITD|nr:unnamed protein product [Triticum turgidum subsp. durum]